MVSEVVSCSKTPTMLLYCVHTCSILRLVHTYVLYEVCSILYWSWIHTVYIHTQCIQVLTVSHACLVILTVEVAPERALAGEHPRTDRKTVVTASSRRTGIGVGCTGDHQQVYSHVECMTVQHARDGTCYSLMVRTVMVDMAETFSPSSSIPTPPHLKKEGRSHS